MHVKFWGTFGATPKLLSSGDLKQKIREALAGAVDVQLDDPLALEQYIAQLPLQVRSSIGGNTSCIALYSNNQYLIIDAGSGIRVMGLDWMANGLGTNGIRANILMTDTQWDHVQGFPFFVPAFIPGNQFTFHSPFEDMAAYLNRQQDEAFFPVDTEYMQAEFVFNLLEDSKRQQIGVFCVQPKRLISKGSTFAYRIEDGDACIVFASDGEEKLLDREDVEQLIAFFKDADLLIIDTKYRLSEMSNNGEWRHNGALIAADLARQADVKNLIFYHHDHLSSEKTILTAQDDAMRYLSGLMPDGHACQVLVSHDGLGLDI